MLINQIKWNILWSSGVAITNALTLILLAKNLSLESFGVYSLLFAVITFAQFFDGALCYSILRSRNRCELVTGIKNGRGVLIVVYAIVLLFSVLLLLISNQISVVNVSLAIGMSCYFYKTADLNILSTVEKHRGNFKALHRFTPRYIAITSILVLIVLLLNMMHYKSDGNAMVGISSIYFISMLISLNWNSLTPVISFNSIVFTTKQSKGLMFINLINSINSNGKNILLGLNAGNQQLALYALATQIPAKLMQLMQMTTEPLIRYFLTNKISNLNTIKSSLMTICVVGLGLLIVNYNCQNLFGNVLKLSGENLHIAIDVLFFFSISLFIQAATLGISTYFIAHQLDKYNIESSLGNALFGYAYVFFCFMIHNSMSAIDLSIAACIGSGVSSLILILRLLHETYCSNSNC